MEGEKKRQVAKKLAELMWIIRTAKKVRYWITMIVGEKLTQRWFFF